MEKWKKWHNLLKRQPEDLRLEVVLTELMKEGHIREDEFFVLPNGGFHRIVNNDIENMKSAAATTRKTDRALIEVNRLGIYDGLPEALFHQSRKTKPFKSMSTIKEEISYHNKVEENARLFFAPLDHELIMARCMVELNERKMTTDMLDAKDNSGLKKFWSIPNFFSAEEQGKLMLILPLSYRLSADLDAAAEAFAVVLEQAVSLVKTVESHVEEKPQELKPLGDSQLGIHTVTQLAVSNSAMHVKIILGPMGRAEASTYASDQLGNTKLSYLAQYLIPADLSYSIEVLLNEEEQVMQLDLEGDFSRLGVTTYLN